ncbi:hypothetical protein AAVH_26508 [Aphelenchoides avenae]|nr:hypothetical protein AAVH_26508 [Aphelenchus avenae]
MDPITPCLCSKDFVYRHNGVPHLVYHYHKENKTILDGQTLKPANGELEIVGRIEIRGPVNCNVVHN